MSANVVKSNREVIDAKLLAALDDESKVAIILSEDDLNWLIDVLYKLRPGQKDEDRTRWLSDLRLLRDSAFGPRVTPMGRWGTCHPACPLDEPDEDAPEE